MEVRVLGGLRLATRAERTSAGVFLRSALRVDLLTAGKSVAWRLGCIRLQSN